MTCGNDINLTGARDSGRSINSNKHLCLVVSTWCFARLNYANYLQIIFHLSLGKPGFVAGYMTLVSLSGWICGCFSSFSAFLNPRGSNIDRRTKQYILWCLCKYSKVACSCVCFLEKWKLSIENLWDPLSRHVIKFAGRWQFVSYHKARVKWNFLLVASRKGRVCSFLYLLAWLSINKTK